MNAYVFRAALLCSDCAEWTIDALRARYADGERDCRHGLAPWECGDTDCWPDGPYADGGGEADSPQHCDQCNVFLRNPLTSDGYADVERMLDDNHGDPEIEAEWSAFYGVPRLADVDPECATFDRFDICEAHYVYAHDAGDYARRARLDAMAFRARPSLNAWRDLNENAQAIYARLVLASA